MANQKWNYKTESYAENAHLLKNLIRVALIKNQYNQLQKMYSYDVE